LIKEAQNDVVTRWKLYEKMAEDGKPENKA